MSTASTPDHLCWLSSLLLVLIVSPSLAQEPVEADVRRKPIKITMRVAGSFSKGYSWSLVVDENQGATLTVNSRKIDKSLSAEVRAALQRRYPVLGEPKQSFTVSAERIIELREYLIRERYFSLGSSYGDQVADSSTTTIAIRVGTSTKIVEMHFLRHEDAKLSEIRRAVRVALLIRGWFDHPDAVDLRRYDEMMLNDPPK